MLDDQRLDMLKHDPQGIYDWVWGTSCRNFGGIFFARDNLLVDKKPIDMPVIVDGIYAVIDTATKTGRENDGTAVTYFAINTRGVGFPLMILDYDIIQIQGDLLPAWLPNVFLRLEELSRQVKSLMGIQGVWIEDKSSGMVLLQHAQRQGWPCHAIESKLTAMGKVEPDEQKS